MIYSVVQINLDKIRGHPEQSGVRVAHNYYTQNEATLINFWKYAEYFDLLHVLVKFEIKDQRRPKPGAREIFLNIATCLSPTWNKG